MKIKKDGTATVDWNPEGCGSCSKKNIECISKHDFINSIKSYHLQESELYFGVYFSEWQQRFEYFN